MNAKVKLDLDQLADAVESREDFVLFVQALSSDLAENPHNWENPTLPRYLDAMASWVPSLDRFYENGGEPVPEQPTWNLLAQVLYAARIYE